MNKSKSLNLEHILYPFQKEFINDKSRFIVWVSARQVGKSFAIGAKAVLTAMKGENYIIMSTSIRNARRIIKYSKKLLKVIEIILNKKIELEVDNADEISLKGMGTVSSIANNIDTAVGYTGHLCIDEASRFSNSEEIMDAVMPFMTRGFSLTMVSTPLGKRGMFWDSIVKARKPNSNWSYHMQTIYDAIDQGCPVNVDLIKQEMDEISFRQNFMCEFIDDISAFFSYELILKCTNTELKNMNFKEIEDTKMLKIAGYDPGKLVDSGVFTILGKHIHSSKIQVIHIKEFKKIDYSEQLAYIVQAMRACCIGKVFVDATGVGIPLCETLKRSLGSAVNEITYTNTIKEQLVTDLKLFMEKDLIEIPDDTRLIDQLHGIEREITPAGNTRYGHDTSKHDDIVLSICNAVSGFSRKVLFDINSIKMNSNTIFKR